MEGMWVRAKGAVLGAVLVSAAIGAAQGSLVSGCQSRAVGIVFEGEDAAGANGGHGADGAGGEAGGADGGTGGAGAEGGSGGAPDAGPDGDDPDADDPDGGTDADPDVPDGGDPDGDVPPTDHCKPAADWESSRVELELELLDAVNSWRSSGAFCDGTLFPPTPALEMEPILRCSARLHTKDMVERNYFSLFNPEGQDPQDRMRAAGWQHPLWGENIYHDNDSPTDVVSLWIAAGGDQCRNVVEARYQTIGVGRFGNLWTMDLAIAGGGERTRLTQETTGALDR